MLFRKIKEDAVLAKIICERCEDEGIGVEIDTRIASDDVLILKVDDFYNSLKLEKTPPSPDCFIIFRCQNGGYGLSVVELKNTKEFELSNLIGKFETCFRDFMEIRFKNFFFRDYNRIDLYFVSKNEIYRRDEGLRMKFLMNKKFEFRNKTYTIKARMPTPAVKPCY